MTRSYFGPGHMPLAVCRGGSRDHPDVLTVMGEHGEVAVRERMGPGGLLHPVPGRPAPAWFYTASPFGAEIIGLAWERHAARAAGKVLG